MQAFRAELKTVAEITAKYRRKHICAHGRSDPLERCSTLGSTPQKQPPGSRIRTPYSTSASVVPRAWQAFAGGRHSNAGGIGLSSVLP